MRLLLRRPILPSKKSFFDPKQPVIFIVHKLNQLITLGRPQENPETAGELFRQLRDPAQNGNRTPAEIVEHLRTPLVLWGWNPGEGRKPIPMPYEEFLGYMTEWVQKGAVCPD